MPNLDIVSGVKDIKSSLREVIQGKASISEALHKAYEGVYILPSLPCLEGLTNKNASNIKKIARELLNSNNYDYVIIDTPPGREAIKLMDKNFYVILVINPEQASVLDALNMKNLIESKGAKLLGIALNMVGAIKKEADIEDIEETLGLNVICMLPFEKKIREAFISEVPFFIYAEPESELAKEVISLAKFIQKA